jgi:hypothetical protein
VDVAANRLRVASGDALGRAATAVCTVGVIKAPQLLQTMRRIEARGAIETLIVCCRRPVRRRRAGQAISPGFAVRIWISLSNLSGCLERSRQEKTSKSLILLKVLRS